MPHSHDGSTLVDYLARRFRYLDAAQWAERIEAGAVTVDGHAVRPDRVVRRGDRVAYLPAEPEPFADPRIEVLHEDPAFLVVAKPAHLVCHADGAFRQNTLVWLLAQRIGAVAHELALAHRLDRETSGVVLLARTRAARSAFERQFTAGTVAKEYSAIVHGRVAADRISIDGALARDPGSAISVRRAVVADGKPARTDCEVVARRRDATRLRVVPRSGRTHQIRAHLASIGHPIVGDKLYGRSDDQYLEYVRHVKAGGHPDFGCRLGAGRQLLHAARLEFDHPTRGVRLAFEAAVPDDLLAYFDGRPA